MVNLKYALFSLAVTLVGITLVSVNLYETYCPIYNATISLPQNVTSLQQIGINCGNGGNAGPVTIVAGQQVIGGNIQANGGAGGNCTINKAVFEQFMKVNVTQSGIKSSCKVVDWTGIAILFIGIASFGIIFFRGRSKKSKGKPDNADNYN